MLPNKSSMTVPIGTFKFFGVSTAPPDTVNPRSIRGLPNLKASEIAQRVPTLLITQPTSAGSPPAGISLFKTDFTTDFSPP